MGELPEHRSILLDPTFDDAFDGALDEGVGRDAQDSWISRR
jgi:hypothetical protein